MDKIIKNKCVVLILILAFFFYNVCDAKAAQKKKEIRHTFTMEEVADYGVPLFVVVNVFSTATEKYTYTSKNVKYNRRSVYAYFKETTSQTYYQCGSEIKNFSWKNDDGLFPGGTVFNYAKYNDTEVTYSRSNRNKAQWTVAVSAPDTQQKLAVKTGTISLYFSSK